MPLEGYTGREHRWHVSILTSSAPKEQRKGNEINVPHGCDTAHEAEAETVLKKEIERVTIRPASIVYRAVEFAVTKSANTNKVLLFVVVKSCTWIVAKSPQARKIYAKGIINR